MVFTIKNNLSDRLFMQAKIMSDAKRIILNHTIRVHEVKLNEYLKKEYNMTLISACLYLLNHSKVQQDKDNNIIVLFKNKKTDNLASLITYGNLELRGSNILKEAFMQLID